MKIIDPGELKNKIEVQRFVNGKDKENRPKEGWENVLRPRAKILNVRGEEFIEAKGIGSKIAKTFYIRAPRNMQITNKDRILYKGAPYNILYVNNIEERNVYLEIKTEYVD